jgi:hypothetical protein
LYKHAMIGTEGWAWFIQTPDGNGRAAHLHLTQHYVTPRSVAQHN